VAPRVRVGKLIRPLSRAQIIYGHNSTGSSLLICG